MTTNDQLAERWRDFGETECRGYSPLYERICTSVAADPPLLERLAELPRHAHQPNVLLAAVHDLVLRGEAPELSEHYEGRSDPEVGALFIETVRREWATLVPVLEQRRTQTNEIGRIAPLALGLAATALAEPPTVIDVGASAGLTLLMDDCHIDFGPHGQLGSADALVSVACEVLHGRPPVRATPVARRLGLDRRPVDLTDPDQARWLVACTWPDTDRLDRTRTAVSLAQHRLPHVRRGDAVADLPALLARTNGALVVTTTWVLAYLSADRRAAFADVLAAASLLRPVTWISAEAPTVVGSLPRIEPAPVDGISASVLGAVHFADGRRQRSEVLAQVHPHGRWIWWYDEPIGLDPPVPT